MKDSASIVVVIFLFIVYFGTIGHYLFRYSLTGYNSYSSVSESFYSMTILMTTANFPDIMLPTYATYFSVILFYGSFLVFGLYFLMNFLLANVFNKFKARLERNAYHVLFKAEMLLISLFDSYD